MTVSPHPAPGRPGDRGDARPRRAYRLAWLSLALLPVSLAAASVLGDWLLTLQGYASGAEEVAPAAAAKASLPALAVLISPALLAVGFGLRARRYGHPSWTAPVTTAVVLAAALLGLNLLQVAVAWVLSW